MKTKMISFTEPQDVALKVMAGRLGISVAELVRRCVDWFFDTYPNVQEAQKETEHELQ